MVLSREGGLADHFARCRNDGHARGIGRGEAHGGASGLIGAGALRDRFALAVLDGEHKDQGNSA